MNEQANKKQTNRNQQTTNQQTKPTGPTNKQTGGGLFSKLSEEIHAPNIWCKPCSINGSFPCYRKRQYCMTEIDDGEILRAIKNIYR